MALVATPNDSRDVLAEVESKLRDKRDALSEALSERDAAKTAFTASGAEISRESKEYQDAEEAVRKVGGLRDDIEDLKEIQVTTLKLLGREAPDEFDDQPVGNSSDPRGDEWDSSRLFADKDVQEKLAWASATKSRVGPIDLGEVASPDAMVTDVTGTSNMRRAPYYGVVPQLRRRLRIANLIPTGTMTGNTLPYTQESGSFDTALETAEGGTKPEAALTLTDADATAATIAHYKKIRKQSLSDWPALRGIVDGRLRYGLLRRLDNQILNGSGSGANMTGILATSGVQTQSYASGDIVTDQVLRAITKIYLADAEATGVVLHPTDWQRALLAKAQYPSSGTPTVGSLEYIGGGPFENTPLTLWGLPCVPTAFIAQNTALVGDFEIGALLLIREGVRVLLSDSDQDDFITNRVTLLAEMRAALPVFQPTAFCIAQLGAAAS